MLIYHAPLYYSLQVAAVKRSLFNQPHPFRIYLSIGTAHAVRTVSFALQSINGIAKLSNQKMASYSISNEKLLIFKQFMMTDQ